MKTHRVERYEPIQIMPAPAGLKARFTQDDGTIDVSDVVALALCRVTVEECETNVGRVIEVTREPNAVMGVINCEGLTIAEDSANFAGYEGYQ